MIQPADMDAHLLFTNTVNREGFYGVNLGYNGVLERRKDMGGIKKSFTISPLNTKDHGLTDHVINEIPPFYQFVEDGLDSYIFCAPDLDSPHLPLVLPLLRVYAIGVNNDNPNKRFFSSWNEDGFALYMQNDFNSYMKQLHSAFMAKDIAIYPLIKERSRKSLGTYGYEYSPYFPLTLNIVIVSKTPPEVIKDLENPSRKRAMQ